ncbi:VanZ family protein [Clostridium estertheticum]|uniref:VanZ family protein n=1 Tax=Clostridium estertheticum TaxID=238834 RepID=UPI001C6E1E5E|nr:VanZ family protein [Clostridium estertheticum]MBW9151322.1 VanZ family protein [Clostridium estertheticum]WLC84702.1 VanZ family protein [Clostridium estertheticum]
MKILLKRKTIVKILLCVVWLGVIFYNGTRPGETSQRTSRGLIEFAGGVMNISPATIEKVGVKFNDVNYYVRKNAHFFQYFVFSILLCSIVRQSKLQRSNKIWMLLFLLLLFPVIDEFIQKYIPSRTSNVLDIVIDFSGGVLGMIITGVRGHLIHLKKGKRTIGATHMASGIHK